MIAVVGISVSVRMAPTTPDPADTVVTTRDEVTRYLAAHVPASVRGAEPPVFIPSRTIVPLVILLQLFVVVTVLSRDREHLEHFGVRPGAVVFTGAAFFFAVVVGHNSLRDEVKASGFIYIESLYIVTYFVILGVALNSVLLLARPNLKLFRNYDNLWARVLYWPVIWLTLLVVTILTFYA
jgi:hypothetical protein